VKNRFVDCVIVVLRGAATELLYMAECPRLSHSEVRLSPQQ